MNALENVGDLARVAAELLRPINPKRASRTERLKTLNSDGITAQNACPSLVGYP
jgi:hypothetical protein